MKIRGRTRIVERRSREERREERERERDGKADEREARFERTQWGEVLASGGETEQGVRTPVLRASVNGA